MIKLIFEKDSPSGEIIISLPEHLVLRSLRYITDITFHKIEAYDTLIKKFEEYDDTNVLIIINDNSNHGFPKRSYIRKFSIEELKYIK